MQAARRLHRRAARDRDRLFLIEGPVALAECLDAGITPVEVFVTEEHAGRFDALRPVVVADPVMAALSDAVTPQGVVAVVPMRDVPVPELAAAGDLVLVLAAVRDPGNAGTLVRSAEAAGAAGVVFCRGSVDPYSPKAVRAAAGSLLRLPVARGADPEEALDDLRAAGFSALAAEAAGGTEIFSVDLRRPVAIVLGNEAWGVPDGVRVDLTVSIPMPGPTESLNVAVAGSLLLFETVRSRRDA